jgi:hypothetical protein
MFGWDESNINQNDAVEPLADMTFDQWWFHGYKERKPASGKFMELVRESAFVSLGHRRLLAFSLHSLLEEFSRAKLSVWLEPQAMIAI